MRLVPALLVLLAGCTDTFLELHPGEVALGEGLTAPYRPQVTTCDLGDVYPAGCHEQMVNIEHAKARGAIAIELGDDGGFWATGLVAGEGEVELSAGGFDERLAIDVAPVAYTMITRWGSSANPLLNAQADAPLVVFTDSMIELWQKHFRAPRDVLALTPLSDVLEVVLHGHTKYRLSAGTTQAELGELADRRAPAPYPRVVLETGSAPGSASVSTLVGGELAVIVVEESAVVSLGDGYLRSGERIDQYSSVLDRFVVAPFDASGLRIAGCPAKGPSLFDTAGILVATRLESSDSCEFQLALAPGQAWRDTTIIVTWNQAELRVPVAPW